MSNSYMIEVLHKIERALADKDWLRVKEYNSELADFEIKSKLLEFQHKPEVVQIELTSKCNAQCVMCSHYYEFNDCGADASILALQQLENVLPYCKLVLLNGYGEPFVSERTLHCLQLLKKYCAKAMVTTNLSVLTNEMIDLIPEVFEEINVSCNGYNKETYEKIHRGLRFNLFSDNLSKLVNAYDTSKISLSCVGMLETVNWASDIIRFAHEKGVKKVRFGRLGVSNFIRNYDQDLTNYQNYAAYHLLKAKKLADDLKVEMVFPGNYQKEINDKALLEEIQKIQKIQFRYDGKYQKELRKEFKIYHSQGSYGVVEQRMDSTDIACSGICDWVGKGLYIDTFGNMYTCCESKFVQYDMWNGSCAQSVRAEFYSGRLPDFCKNCPFIINNELQMLKCEKKPVLYQANTIIPV